MDQAEFRKIIDEGRRCEAAEARAKYIVEQDRMRDRARADAHWKFEHELMVDNYRRQEFYNRAYDPRRWGAFEQARRDLRSLEQSGHAANFQVV